MAGHREPAVRALIPAQQTAGTYPGILGGDRRSAGLQSWAGGAHGLRPAVPGAAFLRGFAARTVQVVIPQVGQGATAMGFHLPRLGGEGGEEVLGGVHGAGRVSPHGHNAPLRHHPGRCDRGTNVPTLWRYPPPCTNPPAKVDPTRFP